MKLIRTLFFIFLVFACVGVLTYYFIIPRLAAEALTSGEAPSLLSENADQFVKTIHTEVESALEELPHGMAEHKLSYDDVVEIVKSTNSMEIVPLIESFQESPPADADEAFDRFADILGKNVADPELFRNAFRKRYNGQLVTRILNYLDASEIPVSMNVDVLRRTVLEILKQEKEAIESQLDQIQSNEQ